MSEFSSDTNYDVGVEGVYGLLIFARVSYGCMGLGQQLVPLGWVAGAPCYSIRESEGEGAAR